MTVLHLPIENRRKVKDAAAWLRELESWTGVQFELRRRFDLSADEALAATKLAGGPS